MTEFERLALRLLAAIFKQLVPRRERISCDNDMLHEAETLLTKTQEPTDAKTQS